VVARSERAKPGVQGFPSHIDVKAEFVEEIPTVDPAANWQGRKAPDFKPTPGVREGLELAFQHPKRPMLLMEYKDRAPSKCRNMAEVRVLHLKNQGYNERNGWIVKNVDAKVYVCYTGVGLDD
jgi:hypothetical protein